MPALEDTSPAPIKWDESQRRVIDAPHGDRLLVGAGPGTGKTAVACARVSKLISCDDLEPSNILLISFTRTAVKEIRDRIANYLENPSTAYAIQIATLDSHAWEIHKGFNEQAGKLNTYEENIERVLDFVQQDENVIEYIEGIEHLVVDEAQDIVGIRADLVVEIIRKLSPTCGATIFADEAQAIYGFADDSMERVNEEKEPPSPEKIRHCLENEFHECELTEVHRTNSSQLLTIFTDTRRNVLAPAKKDKEKFSEIKKEISSLAAGKAPSEDSELNELENTFILYRRRCDVLLKSSMLFNKGIKHRVRMSGLPICLAPWIGATLSEHTELDIDKALFMELWVKRVDSTPHATCTADDAWAQLVRIAGRTDSVVDMHRLRRCLGRKRPPIELCSSMIGNSGPIIGTIHASKGLETDSVHLMLPEKRKSIDQEEEARVLFVGATRGRSELLVGEGYHQRASKVEISGRTYSIKAPRAQVEIGRDIDIEAKGLACHSYFADADAVRDAQNCILGLANENISLIAQIDNSIDFAYRLRENEQGQCIAVLSKSVNNDLFSIANAVQRKISGNGKGSPPKIINHLNVRGVRTVVLDPDQSESEILYEPWKDSGIMLAPIILGYSMMYFPARRRRW